MATTAAVARMQRVLQDNGTAQEWQRQVRAQAEIILAQPPLTQDWVHRPEETAAAPLPLVRPPKSPEGQAAPLDIARLFCLRIQTLAITWLITGTARYRDRAKAELLAVCEFSDWDGDKFLVTAETAFGAAIGYDWLYHFLADEERAQVVQAIVDKAIEPGLAQFAVPVPPYWTTTAMNWNLVCNGALMIAALSIAEADPRPARLFSLCRASIATGFSEYGPDGGWVEGPGYWHYATQYAIYLLDSLATALGTDLGLDASPGLAETGLFRLHAAGPSGKLFNFADGDERHSGGYWLFWLARRYRQPIDAEIEQHAGKAHPMDLLWFEESGSPPTRLPTAKQFSGAGVVMLRGDWNDKDTTYLGIKGGANDACEHGHFDLGSFVLDCGGLRWAMDLGPDDYELPDYFKYAMRSKYYRTGTIGHNTIVINGNCQPYTASAAIVRESFADRISFVLMDLTMAYPETLRTWRGFALIEGRHVLIVDEIEPKEANLGLVVWQMHTAAHVGLDEARATLLYPAARDGEEPARLHLRIVEPAGDAWSLRSAAPSGPEGQDPNEGVAKLVLRREAAAQPLRLAILLSPDRDCDVPEALRGPLATWLPPEGDP
ncbi:MAG: heparinase II/III domain-containing protein [Stellaceae bacterium]